MKPVICNPWVLRPPGNYDHKTKTRMHSSRMRTTRSSSRPGGLSPPGTPRDQTPRDQAPPGTRHSPRGQTHTCKHITLPQTSFPGSKKISILIWRLHVIHVIIKEPTNYCWLVRVSYFIYSGSAETFQRFGGGKNQKKNSTCWLVLVVCNGFQSF